MQKSSSAVVSEKVATKAPEKVLEKRRALGRGLESLLPGPRVVPSVPAVPQSPATQSAEEQSAAPAGSVAGLETIAPPSASVDAGLGRAGTPVAPADSSAPGAAASAAGVTPGTVAELLASVDGEEVVSLDLQSIDENPHQTRRDFNEAALIELRDSIRAQGVIQPIVVRPNGDGRYRLILGERRLRAAQMAGLLTIRAIVKRVSEQQAAEMTLVENLQRQDLNCVEQAVAFQNLSQEFKLTQEEIGARVGVSRETVSNYIRLLILPEGVIGALLKGRLTYSHARALLQLRDNVQIWTLAKKTMEEQLSVAKLEALVAHALGIPAEREGRKEEATPVDPNVRAAQRSLEAILGVRVKINDRQGKGKIVIEYSTLDDFDRVVGMLKGE